MGKMQRTKGATAERELARLLSERLGVEIVRNLEQSRSGGHDLAGVGAFALEVKRCETLSISAWWNQATSQAERCGLRPALAYRQSRKPWRFMVRLCDLAENLTGEETAELCLEGFCLLVREGATRKLKR